MERMNPSRFSGSGKRRAPVQAVFLCNPNSPTGQSVSRNNVYGLLEAVKRQGGCLIVDETFVEFCEEKSVIRRAVRDDSLLVLKSFTKFYGIPGLRIGYAVGTEKTLRAVRDRLPPWSVNTLAQEAALACLQDVRYRQRTLQFFEKERPVFRRALERISGVSGIPFLSKLFSRRDAGSAVEPAGAGDANGTRLPRQGLLELSRAS